MSQEQRKGTKTQLALALARGVSVAEWARATGVPRKTAYRWSHDPEVLKAADAHRRQAINLAIGRMTKHSRFAVDGIVAIAEGADSASVRLRALRALFSDMITLSKHVALEARIAGMEEKIEEQRGAEDKEQRGAEGRTIEIRTTPGNGRVVSLPAMRPEAAVVAGASD